MPPASPPVVRRVASACRDSPVTASPAWTSTNVRPRAPATPTPRAPTHPREATPARATAGTPATAWIVSRDVQPPWASPAARAVAPCSATGVVRWQRRGTWDRPAATVGAPGNAMAPAPSPIQATWDRAAAAVAACTCVTGTVRWGRPSTWGSPAAAPERHLAMQWRLFRRHAGRPRRGLWQLRRGHCVRRHLLGWHAGQLWAAVRQLRRDVRV